jgi:hypothetical protein
MVTLSPAFPSSGETLSSFGASPKQAVDFPVVSGIADFVAAVFGAGALARSGAGFFTVFSFATGSAAQVLVWLIATRLSANTPIATAILEPVVEYMARLQFFVEYTDVLSITGLEAG